MISRREGTGRAIGQGLFTESGHGLTIYRQQSSQLRRANNAKKPREDVTSFHNHRISSLFLMSL